MPKRPTVRGCVPQTCCAVRWRGYHEGSCFWSVSSRTSSSAWLFDLLRDPIVLDFSDSSEMRSIVERLLLEERTGAPASRAMMNALMKKCLVFVFRT